MVFAWCFAGYWYQTVRFSTVYRNKPTIVQLEVENDGLAEFPAVTVCNMNRLRKSEFCNYFPQKCEDRENVTQTEQEITDIIYQLMVKKEWFVKRQLGHSETDMIQDCFYNGQPNVDKQECIENLVYSYDLDYGNCYTIPSRNSKGQILEAREADYWAEENDLTLLLHLETDELLESKRDAGLRVTVHDFSMLPDIHTDGIEIVAGQAFDLAFEKSTVIHLPFPYKSNCTNYFDLHWQKRYRSRMTSRLCTVGCSQYFQLEKCDYITKSLSTFFDVLPFDASNFTYDQVVCAEMEEKNTIDYCRSVCALPCEDTTFVVNEGIMPLSKQDLMIQKFRTSTNHSWEYCLKNLALVKLFFGSLEHKIYRHLPKYDTLELFSYLGGYSGVWLGFSLLTIYEFLEIIFFTMLFAVRKYRRQMVTSKITSRKRRPFYNG